MFWDWAATRANGWQAISRAHSGRGSVRGRDARGGEARGRMWQASGHGAGAGWGGPGAKGKRGNCVAPVGLCLALSLALSGLGQAPQLALSEKIRTTRHPRGSSAATRCPSVDITCILPRFAARQCVCVSVCARKRRRWGHLGFWEKPAVPVVCPTRPRAPSLPPLPLLLPACRCALMSHAHLGHLAASRRRV